MIISIICLIPSFLLVAFWQKHPILSIFISFFLAYFALILAGLLPIYWEMKVEGAADPVLVAGKMSEALVISTARLFLVVPILIVLQSIMRAKRRHKIQKEETKALFE